MWIKICGITSREDAESAIAAGADALGFIFAPSPRRVTAEQVRSITRDLPEAIEKVGVFVDTPLPRIEEICQLAGLTAVQLHGSGYAGCQPNRTASGGSQLRLLHVVRYDTDQDRFSRQLQELHQNSRMNGQQDAVLVDTCVAGQEGGTGMIFDWLGARECLLREAPHLRLIAAGGLNPENVRQAIHTLHPWGVDVSSGVERSPGKKDPGRVAAFVQAARDAERESGKAHEM